MIGPVSVDLKDKKNTKMNKFKREIWVQPCGGCKISRSVCFLYLPWKILFLINRYPEVTSSHGSQAESGIEDTTTKANDTKNEEKHSRRQLPYQPTL